MLRMFCIRITCSCPFLSHSFCIAGNVCRSVHTFSPLGTAQKIKDHIRDCYAFLNVAKDCDQNELKEAYLKLAKRYHPDSGSPTADHEMFAQVETAHRTALQNLKRKICTEDEDGSTTFNTKYTAPQHRQYLSYEGVGYGSPGQRQRQYQQYKVLKATDLIYEHRTEKLAAESENTLVLKDKQAAQKMKIRNALDRLVEDLIQQSMSKGDFNNLSGMGKPLKYTDRNPLVDVATHNINKILINNRFTPEWITLEKEIKDELKKLRETLANERQLFLTCQPSVQAALRWQQQVQKSSTLIKEINLKIDKFNMIVPIINKQLVHYSAERELRRISENCVRPLHRSKSSESQLKQQHQTPTAMDWSAMWKNIKGIFKK